MLLSFRELRNKVLTWRGSSSKTTYEVGVASVHLFGYGAGRHPSFSWVSTFTILGTIPPQNFCPKASHLWDLPQPLEIIRLSSSVLPPPRRILSQANGLFGNSWIRRAESSPRDEMYQCVMGVSGLAGRVCLDDQWDNGCVYVHQIAQGTAADPSQTNHFYSKR